MKLRSLLSLKDYKKSMCKSGKTKPRKVISFVTIFFMVCVYFAALLPNRAEAADITAVLSPSSGTYSSSFSIKLNVTGTDIAGVDFSVTYDTSLVSVTSVALGDDTSTWSEISKTTSGGTIRYAIGVGSSSPQPITGTGEAAVITFSPTGTGTLDLDFSNFEATDSTPSSLSVSATGGSYVLSASSSSSNNSSTSSNLPNSAIISPAFFGITLGGAVTGAGATGILFLKNRREKKKTKEKLWMQ